MNRLKHFLCLFLFMSSSSFAVVEIHLGLDLGNLDFDDSSGSEKDKYDSFNLGFHGGARLGISAGIFDLGAVGWNSWNDMNLSRNISSGSDNTFSVLAYGPFIGIRAGNQFRLNLEYYTNTTHTIMWAEPKSANYFDKDDKISGKGYGVGVTIHNGSFMYDVMFQRFVPDEISMDGTDIEYESTSFHNAEIFNMSFGIGLSF